MASLNPLDPQWAITRQATMLLAILIGNSVFSLRADEPSQPPKLRRPVAMIENRGELLLACRETGTIVVIDRDALKVTAEHKVANQLTDLAVLPGREPAHDRLLAVSIDQPRLIVLQPTGNNVTVVRELSVPRFPVSVCVSPNGLVTSVASKWSRRVALFRRNPDSDLKQAAVVDLPFAPLKQCFLNPQFLLIADTHGGGLAVIDVDAGTLRSQQKLIGHNIRGMTLSPDGTQVVLTHQILTSASSTTQSIISWGGVISNTLHTIPVAELVRSISTDKVESIHGSLFPLGKERQAGGDPGNVVIDSNGRTFVSLSGVSDVATRDARSLELSREPTAAHPTDLFLDESRRELFVLCSFDDAVLVLNPDTLKTRHTIQLARQRPDKTPLQTGEELFYDASLSLDGWFSCHSCHSDGHTIGLLNDNFSDGSFNTPKKILTLSGTGDTAPWAWNGGQGFLRYQVQNSIESTMAGPGKHRQKLTGDDVSALVRYVRSLPPAPGLLVARDELSNYSEAIERGRQVFEQHGCRECHTPPTYTSPDSYDVGLNDEAGVRKFNPPSLRGVSQRAPYFHDNRAARLIDVLNEHAGASSLTDADRLALVRFLESL
jgi:DNA-binding beta-propeller fold protein YncE